MRNRTLQFHFLDLAYRNAITTHEDAIENRVVFVKIVVVLILLSRCEQLTIVKRSVLYIFFIPDLKCIERMNMRTQLKTKIAKLSKNLNP